MAQGRKYATLPDLDSAPDVYETIQQPPQAQSPRSSRSSSRSSTYQETPQEPLSDDNEASGLDRTTLRPGQARSRFSPARVDARGVDFSENVANRKSYRVSSRRRKQNLEAFGGREDLDEDESYQEKLARLKREIEELKLEGEKRAGIAEDNDDGLVHSMSKTLSQLEQDDSTPQKETESTAAPPTQSIPDITSLLTTPTPSNAQTERALTLASTLETRLASLETALGLPSLSLPSHTKPQQPILPHLQTLDRQLTLLTNTTGPSLTSLSAQIQSLTQSAEALTAARKQAAQAKSDLRTHAKNASSQSFSRPLSGQSFSHSRPSSYYGARRPTDAQQEPESPRTNLDSTAQALLAGEETEQGVQVRKLYETLPTVEALAPLVPGLLERLRSLHALHADAAGCAENLEQVEKRQSEMAGELTKWREALDGLEGKMKECEAKEMGNRVEVEKWVKELEERVGKLGENS